MPRPKHKLERTGYALWAADPRHNLSEVARKLGLPRSTVENWKESNDWDGQLAEDSNAVLARAFRAIEGGLGAAAARLVQVIENPDSNDRDAIAASRELFGLVGARKTIEGGTGGQTNILVDKMLVQQLGELSTAELMQRAAELLESNIHDASNLRNSKRQALPKIS